MVLEHVSDSGGRGKGGDGADRAGGGGACNGGACSGGAGEDVLVRGRFHPMSFREEEH